MQRAQVKSQVGLIETCRVLWESELVTVTADEAIAPQNDPEKRSALEEAKEFLSGRLADGSVAKRDIEQDADGADFARATIRRAKKILGVKAYREGYGKDGIWKWRLPRSPKMIKESKDDQTKEVITFENFDHLCGDSSVVEVEI